MRDYIFSLMLLAIFLGAYTALVLGFGKSTETLRSRPTAQSIETSPRDPAATQQVAVPSDQD